MALILDAGALIAIDRSHRQLGLLLRRAYARAIPVRTSAAVVGQVWRAGARQAVLARTLAGVEVRALDEETGRRIGQLLGVSRTTDVVDAHIALITNTEDALVTSDPDDLAHLTACAGVAPRVIRV